MRAVLSKNTVTHNNFNSNLSGARQSEVENDRIFSMETIKMVSNRKLRDVARYLRTPPPSLELQVEFQATPCCRTEYENQAGSWNRSFAAADQDWQSWVEIPFEYPSADELNGYE